ncbi:MAG: extracellular solute-binding protein, partial [Cyanobacteria bacterium J06636_27]
MLDFQVVNKLKKILQNLNFKVLAIFIIVLFGMITFSSHPAQTQEPVTLNLLMTAPDAEPWKQGIIKDFEAKNPGIRINIIEGPNATNLLEDLYTSAFILGDSPYDLINMDVIWTPKFAAANWLLDLTDKITEEELAAFSKKDVEVNIIINNYRPAIESGNIKIHQLSYYQNRWRSAA